MSAQDATRAAVVRAQTKARAGRPDRALCIRRLNSARNSCAP